MLSHGKRKTSGFTLVELAIVLGIAGILFGGLWRLLSTSNVQMRDQATASQHQQVAKAVAAYLQSTGTTSSGLESGQAFLAKQLPGATVPIDLPAAGFPAGDAAQCAAHLTDNKGICDFLPAGFSANTTNPYGQKYFVRAMKDSALQNVAPQTYSFMIITSGGEKVADSSGGRISAMIGADGGFIYNNDVCNTTPTYACGSFGAWATRPETDFGFVAGASKEGHVASRTFFLPSQGLGDWLARNLLPSDSASNPNTPVYNTMRTHLFLGGGDTSSGRGVFFGVDKTSLTGGADTWMHMQGGKLSTEGGMIDLGAGGLNPSIHGTLALGNGKLISLETATGATKDTPPLIYLQGCIDPLDPNCQTYDAILVSRGNITITEGLIESQTFTYSASDVRLKRDIQPLIDPLDDLMKVKPVSFVYKSNGKHSMGVIAQEVEKIYPEIVIDRRDGMKSVAYEGLIAPLVGSVQKLKMENDDLKIQLREQAARQEKMQKDIERLLKK